MIIVSLATVNPCFIRNILTTLEPLISFKFKLMIFDDLFPRLINKELFRSVKTKTVKSQQENLSEIL